MSTPPDPDTGAPDERRALSENSLVARTHDLTQRTWAATSPDGHVTVVAGGDLRLRQVTINTPDVPVGLLGRAATTAANEALTTARRETVEAMRELPDLPTDLRQLLGRTS